MRQQHVHAYVRSQDSGSDDGARFCQLLRSSKFDEETSVARPWEPIRIHDEAESGLFNFRAHLTTSMQPIFVKTAKNAEYFLETASVNYPDDDWRSGVLADMRASRFILIAPHWPSDSLRWELEQVIGCKLLEKTFIVAPPLLCFGPYPRRFDRQKEFIQMATSAWPKPSFTKFDRWNGHEKKYEEEIRNLSNRLARNHECQEGWAIKQHSFCKSGF